LLIRYSFLGKDVPIKQDFRNVFKNILKDDISSNNEDLREDKEPGEFNDLFTPNNFRPFKKLRVLEGFQPRSKIKSNKKNYRLANNIIVIYNINDFLITVSDKFNIKIWKNVFPVLKFYIYIIRMLSSLY